MTLRKATKETPFSLTYGTESLIPTEIAHSPLRVQVFNRDSKDEGLRAKLDLLEEHRELAELQRKAFQQRISTSTN